MYDHIKTYRLIQILDFEKPLPQSCLYNGLIFHPIWRKGSIVSYTVDDEFGFRHTITSNRYYIQNSLHKGNNKLRGTYGNHNSFMYQDALSIIMFLSNRYDLPLNETFVTKLEIGVNILVNKSPMDYIKKLRSVQFIKEPENMRHYNRVYGKKIILSQFSFKLYDKTYQSYHEYRQRINKNIVRFELAYNNITPIKEYAATLGHLIDLDNYIALAEILDRRFRSLTFNSNQNLDGLTPREVDTYYAGVSSDYWRHIQKINKYTAATKRRKYQQIMKKLEPRNSDELLLELRLKSRKKINELV